MEEFDLLIRNAAIIDGSGRPAYKGSIGITGDKAVAVSPVTGDTKEAMIVRSLLFERREMEHEKPHRNRQKILLPRIDEHQV